MDIILRNAKAVLENSIEDNIDIAIDGDKIAKIGKDLTIKANQEFNLNGKLTLPGIIDTQVHFREPGLIYKEDIKTGSKSAVLGGVTTYLEMPNTNPPTTDKLAIEEKINIAKKNSYANFGFFMGATANNLSQLINAHNIKGCCGIKVFLGSSTGDLLLYDPNILSDILKQTSSTIAFHSEDEKLLRENIKLFKDTSNIEDHQKIRSVQVALSSTKKIVELAKACHRKIHLLHITTTEEIKFLKTCKDICTVEVTPQHLTLSAPECYRKLKAYAQMNPPIREKSHQDTLWKGINDGTVDVIGSDHAPHTKEEKEQNYPHTPSGMPGVQTTLPVMLEHVNQNKLTLRQLVKLLCENPVKIYNLKDRGYLKENMIADIAILNKQKHTITSSDMGYKCGWTPFEGMQVNFKVDMTIVNGKIVVKDSKIVSEPSGVPCC